MVFLPDGQLKTHNFKINTMVTVKKPDKQDLMNLSQNTSEPKRKPVEIPILSEILKRKEK